MFVIFSLHVIMTYDRDLHIKKVNQHGKNLGEGCLVQVIIQTHAYPQTSQTGCSTQTSKVVDTKTTFCKHSRISTIN